ncbi:MAG: MBL fold metallo-hydrolase [Candidatus Lokiarchaeota archaeon]|nr:MBL fold metallo-hydrolase [Candidatus Lokiarchaeota archaeon]
MYLFKIDDTHILVDAGLNFPDWKRKFFSELKKLNLSINDIDYLIITHDHPDHVGLMEEIKHKNPDIQVLMHEITHDTIKWMTDPKNEDEIKNSADELKSLTMKYGITEEMAKTMFGFSTNMHRMIPYIKPDRILNDNDEIKFDSTNLKFIWTPGHSLGHICVFEESNRHLFAGDHILSRITPNIGTSRINPIIEKKFDFTNILDLYLKSLDKIDKLDPKIIFPAHQEIIYNPHQRILEMKQHHDNRLSEVSKVIENNALTPYRISQIHFGEDLDGLNTLLALSEVLSHLIYLENQGKIKRIEKNNKLYFLKET